MVTAFCGESIRLQAQATTVPNYFITICVSISYTSIVF